MVYRLVFLDFFNFLFFFDFLPPLILQLPLLHRSLSSSSRAVAILPINDSPDKKLNAPQSGLIHCQPCWSRITENWSQNGHVPFGTGGGGGGGGGGGRGGGGKA